jgi:hypothetical protein
MLKLKSFYISLLCTTLVISGCATNNGGGTSSNAGCKPETGALVGALIGAALASQSKDSGAAVGGALAGAWVGALSCVAINAYTRQTATAAEVRSSSPAVVAPALQNYRADAPRSVPKGSDVVINTFATVVTPNDNSRPNITESIALYAPGMEGPKTQKKLAQDGGSFTQTYTIPLTSKVPAGDWTFTTTLFIDGKAVQSKTGRFTVV